MPGTTQENHAPQPVDLLVLGHVTRDLLTNDPQNSPYTLGGTVSFAAVTAVKLGHSVAVITSAAPDTDLSRLPPEVQLHVLPSDHTTTFANIYTDTGRIQYLYATAAPIRAADVPEALRHPRIALMGPLVNEVEPEVAAIFSDDTLVAAVPQGWMRRWDETGRVYSEPWHSQDQILPHLDVLVLSLEDIDYDLQRLEAFFAHVPIVVVTQYRDGSTVYERQADGSIRATQVPPRPANEVDPTGAGDIFATAFLLRFKATNDPVHAARYANVTASFGVEALGIEGIPTHGQVMEYLEKHG